MNTSSTKRSLVVTMLSIVMCAALLVGATYAWFASQQEVGAGNIVVGTFGMKVESKTSTGWDEVATGTTLNWELADGYTVWQPGASGSLPVLKITNTGSINQIVTAKLANSTNTKLAEEFEIKLIPCDVNGVALENPAESVTLSENGSAYVKLTATMKNDRETAPTGIAGETLDGIKVVITATQPH